MTSVSMLLPNLIALALILVHYALTSVLLGQRFFLLMADAATVAGEAK